MSKVGISGKKIEGSTAQFLVERDVRETLNCEEQNGDKS